MKKLSRVGVLGSQFVFLIDFTQPLVMLIAGTEHHVVWIRTHCFRVQMTNATRKVNTDACE